VEVKIHLYDEMKQSVVCPSCRSTDLEDAGSRTLSDDFHCNDCGLDFTVRQLAVWLE
jgi:transposase-like protein